MLPFHFQSAKARAVNGGGKLPALFMRVVLMPCLGTSDHMSTRVGNRSQQLTMAVSNPANPQVGLPAADATPKWHHPSLLVPLFARSVSGRVVGYRYRKCPRFLCSCRGRPGLVTLLRHLFLKMGGTINISTTVHKGNLRNEQKRRRTETYGDV